MTRTLSTSLRMVATIASLLIHIFVIHVAVAFRIQTKRSTSSSCSSASPGSAPGSCPHQISSGQRHEGGMSMCPFSRTRLFSPREFEHLKMIASSNNRPAADDPTTIPALGRGKGSIASSFSSGPGKFPFSTGEFNGKFTAGGLQPLKSSVVAPPPSSFPSTSLNRKSTNPGRGSANGAAKGAGEDMKLGVLLLNLGGPETMQDVEGFLYNLFADPDIIRLPKLLAPLQKPIAYVIARRRAKKSSEAYRSIGGGSPIVKYTQAQADLITEALSRRGDSMAKRVLRAKRLSKPGFFSRSSSPSSSSSSSLSDSTTPPADDSMEDGSTASSNDESGPESSNSNGFPHGISARKAGESALEFAGNTARALQGASVYFAMRYWHPYTEEALQAMQDDGINTLVIVPLYPQFSISTSGSSLKLLQEIFAKQPEKWGADKLAHTVVPAWYYRPGYLEVMARLVIDQIAHFSEEEMKEGVHVLFSAHGVPESYIEAGDPYQRQIEECVKLVSREVSRQLSTGSYFQNKEKEAKLRSKRGEKNSKIEAAFMAAVDESKDSSSSGSKIGLSPSAITQETALRLAGAVKSNREKTASKTTENDQMPKIMWQNPLDGTVSFTQAAAAAAASSSLSLSSAEEEAEEEMVEGEKESAVKEVQYHLSFQSRVGPVKWLQPYTEEKLQELGQEKGVKNLVVVPVSFVSEHIETLEEIDMEYKEVAEEFGVRHWRRVPALNTDQLFIEDMADMVVEALEAPALSVSEASAMNIDNEFTTGAGSAAGSSYAASSSSSSAASSSAAGGGGQKQGVFGLTESAETLNGRFAMIGFLGTTLIEILNGHALMPILSSVGIR